MKKLLLCLLVPLTVHSQSTTTSFWETPEYLKSGTLSSIKASSAYARGYTGAGSTIAIIDSGIASYASEFRNKIVLTKDFTGGNSILDKVGHGTHVAGIAAAARDGSGMEGVAFGSNLMIAKVTNSNSMVSMNLVVQGVDWAASNGATVANVSVNTTIPKSLVTVAGNSNGFFMTTLTNTGKYFGDNPVAWANAMKNDIVVVVSAGNEGTAWSAPQSQMATATDSKGKLLLGGRMIVAGDWNTATNNIASTSNRAGTLCMVAVNGVCQDKYKLSDFYLMAPGMNITSVGTAQVPLSSYANMSGTSMSAPVISGGVAIIHQMWPKMTGENIAKLLLTTANKNLPGYNVNVMGQGLMDLEKATRPVGPVGISTVGRTAPVKYAPVVITGGSAGTGALKSIMVMDSFDRDFYVNGKSLTATQVVAETNVQQVAIPYFTRNNYSQFNSYTDHFTRRAGNLEFTMYKDTRPDAAWNNSGMIEFGYNSGNVKYTGGMFTEQQQWLGNSTPNASSNNFSSTYFFGVGSSTKIASDVEAYGSLYHGTTFAKAESELISNLRPVMSYSWTLGLEKKLSKTDGVGIMLYQPVSAYRAVADTSLATGLDENFNPVGPSKINLAATVHELRTGVYYKISDTKAHSNVLAFYENRKNYAGQEGVTANVFGISANHSF